MRYLPIQLLKVWKRKDNIAFLVKGMVLLLPIVAFQFIELFVLPIDFFTFRVWEAAISPDARFPGMFYPNLSVVKNKEFGDRYRLGGDFVQSKRVEWYTDAYGWRNRREVEKSEKYDIVVTGDSNIVGSFLDQKDTLSEVLARNTNLITYSYSAGHDHISLYFSDPRMAEKETRLLVVESKVGNWFSTKDYLTNFVRRSDNTLAIRDRKHEFESNFYRHRSQGDLELAILKSRFKKQPLYHKLRSDLLIDSAYLVPNPTATIAQLMESQKKAPDIEVSYSLQGNIRHGKAFPAQTGVQVRGPNASITIELDRPSELVSTHISFQAKTTITPSAHQVWLVNGNEKQLIDTITTTTAWKDFVFRLPENQSEHLKLQIDQTDKWQFLSLRNANPFFRKVVDHQLPKSNDITRLPIKSSKGKTQCAEYDGIPSSNLAPLDVPAILDPVDSQYYFYQAAHAMKRGAESRKQDLVILMLPDTQTYVLMPVIRQLRCEGVKIIAYENSASYAWGVDHDWYWQRADSHWTEAAVRLTADEIHRMWITNAVANRQYSESLSKVFAQIK
jgi:hypothetical protein